MRIYSGAWGKLYLIYIPHKHEIVSRKHVDLLENVFPLAANNTEGGWAQKRLDDQRDDNEYVIPGIGVNRRYILHSPKDINWGAVRTVLQSRRAQDYRAK